MKFLRSPFLFLTLAVALLAPAAFTLGGCGTPVTERSQAVTTLKAIGLTVDTSMTVAAKMYHDGKISQAQWQQIADFHDLKFMPAYHLAVDVVQADLSSIATPDVINLAGQLGALVASFQTH